MEPLHLKGKSVAVAAHRLRGLRPDAGGIGRVADAPLVGRRRQLAGATLAYEVAVEDRACSLLTILGEVGVGKTRLAAEVVSVVEADARVLTGRCLPYGRGITYWPLAEMVREVCGAPRDQASGMDIAVELRAVLDGVAQAQAVAGNLAAVAGAGTAAARDELPWAVRKLLEHLAAERPLVALFEDIHWAEPALLDLIEDVVEWSRDAPLLILCTARPELLDRRPAWGGGKRRATTLQLESLPPGDAAEMIRHRLGGEVDSATLRGITAATDGNPLFIEQLVAMLVESGRLTGHGETWSVSPIDLARMPPSIQALLAARLDSLAPSEREVVDVASVVGKEFDLDAVVALSGTPQAAVSTDLLSLLRRDVIRAESGSLTTFRFRHILIRDAAYEMLTKERRADLHERFADWLEDSAGAGIAEVEEIAGYHLEQACAYIRELRPGDARARGLALRAAAHLHSGGGRALDRGDMAAAVDLLTRARELAATAGGDVGDIDLALAAAHEDIGAFDAARPILEGTIQAARASGDRRLELRAELQVAAIALSEQPEGAAERCRAVAEEAIPVFTAAADHRGLALAWDLWCEPDHMWCRWAPMTAALERAPAQARLAGDGYRATRLAGGVAHGVCWGPVPLDEALTRCRELLGDVAALPHLVARIRGRIGVLLAMAGRDEEAVSEIVPAEAILHDLRNDYFLGSFGLAVSNVHLWARRHDEAERLLRSADAVFAKAGERSVRSTVLAGLAKVLLAQGRLADADQAALLALEVGSADDLATVITAVDVQAQILAARGQAPEAVVLARTAVDKLGDTDMLSLIGEAWEVYGRVLLTEGRRDAGADALVRAAEAYERKGAVALVAGVASLRAAAGA